MTNFPSVLHTLVFVSGVTLRLREKEEEEQKESCAAKVSLVAREKIVGLFQQQTRTQS